MKPLPPVSVLNARPIGNAEFLEAIAATCAPVLGNCFRTLARRDVGLAVSGGVDSMALAVLCQKICHNVHVRIGDHRPRQFRPLVVDHGLRKGSTKEARNVICQLNKLGLSVQASYLKLDDAWRPFLTKHQVDHPNQLPGLEAIARRLRYRAIAKSCTVHHITSLLLAHHEDDQYETVMMRLIGGHRFRGLCGMRPAIAIPESYDIHRAHKSGCLDDQSSARESYLLVPAPRQCSALQNQLSSLDHEIYNFKPCLDNENATVWESLRGFIPDSSLPSQGAIVSSLRPLAVENGGITVYRPLLNFSKDRLIATCLANGVSWVEDHTNHDPSFTTRNALRYLYMNHTFPKALQKPSILALAKRCQAKVEAEEAEAQRLLRKTIVTHFQSNVGTVMVRFPNYGFDTFPTRDKRISFRSDKRAQRRRAIAALVLREIFSLVAPVHRPDLSVLASFVDIFFPGLTLDGQKVTSDSEKAISISGVYCVRIRPYNTPASSTVFWHLSRAPFPKNRKPSLRISTTGYSDWAQPPVYSQFQNWDGRFWIHLSHRIPTNMLIAPFSSDKVKELRDSLDEQSQKRLEFILKQYAPGKIRFTLPALYIDQPQDDGLIKRNLSEWSRRLEKFQLCEANSPCGENEQKYNWMSTGRQMIVALPSLGIQIPGLEKLIRCEVRYKHVNVGLLENKYSNINLIAGAAEKRRWKWMIRKQAYVWRHTKRSDLQRKKQEKFFS